MQVLNIFKDTWRRNGIFFIATSLVIAADQLSKLWIKSSLAIGEPAWDIGFFRLYHISNTGAAFGIFQGHALLLTIIDIVGACFILFTVFSLYKKLPFLDSMPFKISLALIFGGTIGNLIDRLGQGHVTDFIDFSFWATFNIADSAVVVGAILLAFLVIRLTGDSEQEDGKTS